MKILCEQVDVRYFKRKVVVASVRIVSKSRDSHCGLLLSSSSSPSLSSSSSSSSSSSTTTTTTEAEIVFKLCCQNLLLGFYNISNALTHVLTMRVCSSSVHLWLYFCISGILKCVYWLRACWVSFYYNSRDRIALIRCLNCQYNTVYCPTLTYH